MYVRTVSKPTFVSVAVLVITIRTANTGPPISPHRYPHARQSPLIVTDAGEMDRTHPSSRVAHPTRDARPRFDQEPVCRMQCTMHCTVRPARESRRPPCCSHAGAKRRTLRGDGCGCCGGALSLAMSCCKVRGMYNRLEQAGRAAEVETEV